MDCMLKFKIAGHYPPIWLTEKLGIGVFGLELKSPFKFVIEKRIFLAKIVDTRTGSATPGWRLLTMTW